MNLAFDTSRPRIQQELTFSSEESFSKSSSELFRLNLAVMAGGGGLIVIGILLPKYTSLLPFDIGLGIAGIGVSIFGLGCISQIKLIWEKNHPASFEENKIII